MENPKPFSDEQIEQARQMTVRLGEHAQAATQALAKAFTPLIQRQMAALKPLIEWGNSLEGRAAITAYYAEHGIYPRAREVQACHCFCAHNHSGERVCLGEVDAGEVRTLRYGSDLTGPVDVPMCPPCADAVVSSASPPAG
jgi:hypothetical protein